MAKSGRIVILFPAMLHQCHEYIKTVRFLLTGQSVKMEVQLVRYVYKTSSLHGSYNSFYDFAGGLARWTTIGPHSSAQTLSESLLYA